MPSNVAHHAGMQACHRGQPRVVPTLFEIDADLFTSWISGYDAAHEESCFHGLAVVVLEMLDTGVSPHADGTLTLDPYFLSLLQKAATDVRPYVDYE